uniref:FHA domain-containing protein n=1 Tax=Scleropages formosus TaxID=113540 RepID=A0A8C9S7E6_SCLFO
GLKVQTATPHLVSLGSGRLSVAITLLPLNEGSARDITIEGPGIEAEHCQIENRAGIITLDPCGNLCALDGVVVTKPTQLTQGYTLCLGKSYFFRFNHPEEATRMKSMLPQKSPVSYLGHNFHITVLLSPARDSTSPALLVLPVSFLPQLFVCKECVVPTVCIPSCSLWPGHPCPCSLCPLVFVQ